MKRFLLFWIFILMVLAVFAQGQTSRNNANGQAQREPSTHVTATQAREVGLKFLNANAKTKLRSANELQLATTYRTSQGDEAFYVFNTQNGFVMVAADRCATPILGYSDEGAFDVNNVPIQMQSYLQGFVEQIAYGQEHNVAADARVEQQWQQVRSTGQITSSSANVARENNLVSTMMASNRMTKSVMMTTDSTGKMVRKEVSLSDLMNGTAENSHIVMPTLPQHYRGSRSGSNGVAPLITANWDQGCYYNAQCPADTEGVCGHVPTGCVATAMGMIMRYWGYPAQGTGTHSYTPDGYPEQTVNFAATTYDWDNMPDQLDANSTQAQIDAVSTLLWHCGVAVEMMYSSTSSGTLDLLTLNAFHEYFGYCTPYFNLKTNDSEWLMDVKASLNHGRPLLYFATDVAEQVTHAFVCDGYNSANQLHFNWGWGGNGNGYYAIDALNVGAYQFSEDIYALFGIMPQSEFQLCYNIVEGGAEVTYGPKNYSCPNQAYDSYPDTIVIPPSANINGIDYPVIAIGDSAFTCCENLKSVVLPNTIKTIGRRAFDANFSLTSVNFPNSLRTIKESAFIGALSLSEINLPDSIETLEPWCFAYTALTEITIPRSLTTIGDGLCAYDWIQTVYWNADSCGTQYYDGSALDGGTSLWGSPTKVFIGEHVKHIPELCFFAVQCDSIIIPDSVISIGTGAFIFCDSLKYASMGNSIVDIGGMAFYEDNSLTSVTIPKHVRNIGIAAFANCDVLNTVYYNATNCLYADQTFNWDPITQIIIGNGVTIIPPMLFANCIDLTSVTIPASVNEIGNGSFYSCDNLQTVNMLPTIPPMVCEWSFAQNAVDRVFTVSCESYDIYYSDPNWSCYRSDLRGFDGTEQLLTLISNNAEQGNVDLYSVCDSTAFFHANAYHGYVFDHWSTGSTINPNTLFLSQDTTIVAYFRLDQFDVSGTSAKKVYFSNFENPSDDTSWFFKNNDYPNKWCINNLDNTNRALFISSDNGLTNSCTNTISSVFAYTSIPFTAGDYVYSYKWRDDGHDSYYPGLGFTASGELMESGLILYNLDIDSIDSYGWWMIASYLRANHSGNNDWQIQQGEVQLWYDTVYNLVFYWRLENPQINYSEGYPAAVDNIVFGTLDSECGYVIGADNVNYLDTATIIAVPNPGYRFVCWFDGDTNITKQVVVTGDLTCVAYFEAEQYSVVVNSSDTLLGSVSGGGMFEYFEECTITATPAEGYHFFRWSDGNTDNPRTITVTQDSTLTAIFGTCTDVFVRDTVTACDSYTWNDSVYTQSGDYSLSYTILGGCDSTVVLHLTINQPTISDTTAVACESFTWEGNTYTESGDYTFYKTNAAGCDSIVTLHLTIIPYDTITLAVNDTLMGSVALAGALPEGAADLGGGSYRVPRGTELTVKALFDTADFGFLFWTSGNDTLSVDSVYTFTVMGSDEYTAHFEYLPTPYFYVSKTGWATWINPHSGPGAFTRVDVKAADSDQWETLNYSSSITCVQIPSFMLTDSTLYTVRAVLYNYEPSFESREVTFDWFYVACDHFEGVSNFVGEITDQGVALSWDAGEGPQQYLLYRNYSIIDTLTTTSYLDPEGVYSNKYYVRRMFGGSAVCPYNNDSLSMSCQTGARIYIDLTLTTDPPMFGTAAFVLPDNTGHVAIGGTCTVSATANEGYSFTHWTFNGTKVSVQSTYSFDVEQEGELVAHFEYAPATDLYVSRTGWASWNNSHSQPGDNSCVSAQVTLKSLDGQVLFTQTFSQPSANHCQLPTGNLADSTLYLMSVMLADTAGNSSEATTQWYYVACDHLSGFDTVSGVFGQQGVNLSWDYPSSMTFTTATVDFDFFNGFVTDTAVMSNGGDASWAVEPQSTAGPYCNYASGVWVGDRITLSDTTRISEMEVYAFQNDFSTTSPFTGLYIQIYQGSPEDSVLVWGNADSNLMTATAFTGCYRGLESNSMIFNLRRPIMSLTASGLDIELSPGTYYFVWSMSVSNTINPVAIPHCEPVVGNTGDYGMLYTEDHGWHTMHDGGSGEPFGFAFHLTGEQVLSPVVEPEATAIYRNGELIDITSSTTYTDSEGSADHSYEVRVVYGGDRHCVYGNAAMSMSCPQPVTLHCGETFTGDTTAVACESFSWYGTTYTETPTVAPTHTLTNASGCDSVVTLHLTINTSVAESFEAIACDSYTWNGETYAESGDYIQTFTAANGCDSVVTLHLTVNPSVNIEAYLTISENDLPFTYGDTTFMSGTVQSGDYIFNFTTADGCDSVIILHLTVETGINDYSLNASMKLYPNPTKDLVNVQLTINNEQLDDVVIQLFDVYGKMLDVIKLQSGTSLQTQIDLSRYANGVYLVKAVAEGNVLAVRKVVKK